MCPQAVDETSPFYKQGRDIKRVDMSLDMFDKMLDQVPNSEGTLLEICSFGETIMTKSWPEMLEKAVTSKPEAEVTLVSNAVLLNESNREAILKNPPDILQLSIDAAKGESYEWLTGSRRFDNSRENIREFIRGKNELKLNKPKVLTHIIDLEEFQGEIETFKDDWI